METSKATGAQAQPTSINQIGADGQSVETIIEYGFQDPENLGKASMFQPTGFDVPGVSAGDLDYNNAGKLTTVAISGKNGAAGATTTNDYFEAGEVGVDAWKIGRLQSTTVQATPDAPERVTSYDYKENPHGGVTRVVTDGSTGLVTSSTYDGAGNLVSSTNARGTVVTTETDGEGRIIRATDEQGNSIHTLYNVLGQKYQERLVHVFETGVEPVVITTRYKYDPAGRIVETVRETDDGRVLSHTESEYIKTESGRIEITTGTEGLASRDYYDHGGRLTKTEQLDAFGGVMTWTAFEYDELGRKKKEIDDKGVERETEYDGLGRVKKTIVTAPDNDDVPGPDLNQVVETRYDKAGRVIWKTQLNEDYDELYTLFDYDDLGRLTQTWYNCYSKSIPDGETMPVGDNITSTVTTYDSKGRRWYVIDERGVATKYNYDDATGRIKEIWLGVVPGIDPGISPDVNAGVCFKTEYDPFGNVTRRINPLSHDRIKKYDGKGRLWREYGPLNDDPDSELGVNRQVIEYVYYAAGQVKKKREGIAASPNAAPQFFRTTSYQYDPATGRLLEEKVTVGEETKLITLWTCDGPHEKLSRQETRNGQSAVTHWKNFTYDPRTGQVATIASPEGVLSYTYHRDGSLASLSTASGQNNQYTYGSLGKLKQIRSSVFGGDDEVLTYAYSPKTGMKTDVRYPNGVVKSFNYTERGWVRAIRHINTSQEIILNISTSRDETGNITRLTTRRDESGYDPTWAYSYDNLNRLRTAKWYDSFSDSYWGTPLTSYLYDYDSTGNRRTKQVYDGSTLVEDISYVYDPLDQLLTETIIITGQEPVTKTYTYDRYGNQSSVTAPGRTVDYTWNGKNRLCGATINENGTDQTISFAYDADGLRISKQLQAPDGPATNYLTDMLNPTGYAQTVIETGSRGLPTAVYAWGRRRSYRPTR